MRWATAYTSPMVRVFFFLIALFALLNGNSFAAIASFAASHLPTAPTQGSPLLITVKPAAKLTTLSGEWLGKRVYFDPVRSEGFNSKGEKAQADRAPGEWVGLAGVPLDTPVGSYTLKLTGTDAAGHSVTSSEVIRVEASHYASVELKVAKQFTEPDAATQKRIAEDQKLKHEVFERADSGPDTPLRLWSGGFAPPIPNTASDGFGTKRVFNGKLQSQHQGLDFHAATGTPVHATNRGKVILARSLFFEGNCVIVDHGEGLVTIYMHLSEFKVKEGELVERGQVVGLSGATGRATGPHLHMGVRWQGVYLDPAILLKIELP